MYSCSCNDSYLTIYKSCDAVYYYYKYYLYYQIQFQTCSAVMFKHCNWLYQHCNCGDSYLSIYVYIQMMRWCSSTATDYIWMIQLLMLSYSYNCSCGCSDNYPTMYNCSAVIAILMFQTLQLIISTLSAVL